MSLGNFLTERTPMNKVLCLSRRRRRELRTHSVEITDVQSRMTSGCSSQRSWGLEKEETPRDLVAFEQSEREWTSTVWPWRTKVVAKNCPKLLLLNSCVLTYEYLLLFIDAKEKVKL